MLAKCADDTNKYRYCDWIDEHETQDTYLGITALNNNGNRLTDQTLCEWFYKINKIVKKKLRIC